MKFEQFKLMCSDSIIPELSFASPPREKTNSQELQSFDEDDDEWDNEYDPRNVIEDPWGVDEDGRETDMWGYHIDGDDDNGDF